MLDNSYGWRKMRSIYMLYFFYIGDIRYRNNRLINWTVYYTVWNPPICIYYLTHVYLSFHRLILNAYIYIYHNNEIQFIDIDLDMRIIRI